MNFRGILYVLLIFLNTDPSFGQIKEISKVIKKGADENNEYLVDFKVPIDPQDITDWCEQNSMVILELKEGSINRFAAIIRGIIQVRLITKEEQERREIFAIYRNNKKTDCRFETSNLPRLAPNPGKCYICRDDYVFEVESSISRSGGWATGAGEYFIKNNEEIIGVLTGTVNNGKPSGDLKEVNYRKNYIRTTYKYYSEEGLEGLQVMKNSNSGGNPTSVRIYIVSYTNNEPDGRISIAWLWNGDLQKAKYSGDHVFTYESIMADVTLEKLVFNGLKCYVMDRAISLSETSLGKGIIEDFLKSVFEGDTFDEVGVGTSALKHELIRQLENKGEHGMVKVIEGYDILSCLGLF